jgi:hypothetical protein
VVPNIQNLRRLKRVATQPDQFSSGDPFGWYSRRTP